MLSDIMMLSIQKAIDDVKVTANFDKPVGMFDGLTQAMVCGVSIHKLINLYVWKHYIQTLT